VVDLDPVDHNEEYLKVGDLVVVGWKGGAMAAETLLIGLFIRKL
jgi:hypothetical protein